jgi:glycosyltransferase involved in cell wall biosynthesis
MEKRSPTVDAKSGAQVTLIVPTLRRPDFLYRCLRSLESQQTSHSIEVLVGIRADDDVSPPVIRKVSDTLQIRQVDAKGVGVVGSMNSCLAQTQAEFIGFVDDDVELPPNWVEIMICHLERHPDVLGAAGRDLLQDHPEMRRTEPRILDVGRLHWFGRITGNQYRGGGKPRKVDVLRGSNCLFRGAFLRGAGLDEILRGQGAQVHWEVALALQARRQGKRLFYDPEIEVIHHVAPRLDSDQIHRGRFSYDATVDLAFNETIVILKYASGLFRITALLWQLVVGSPQCPGLATLIRSALRGKSVSSMKIRATLKGRFLAWVAIGKSLRGIGSNPAK